MFLSFSLNCISFISLSLHVNHSCWFVFPFKTHCDPSYIFLSPLISSWENHGFIISLFTAPAYFLLQIKFSYSLYLLEAYLAQKWCETHHCFTVDVKQLLWHIVRLKKKSTKTIYSTLTFLQNSYVYLLIFAKRHNLKFESETYEFDHLGRGG